MKLKFLDVQQKIQDVHIRQTEFEIEQTFKFKEILTLMAHKTFYDKRPKLLLQN